MIECPMTTRLSLAFPMLLGTVSTIQDGIDRSKMTSNANEATEYWEYLAIVLIGARNARFQIFYFDR
jgi:hypothetical protein